MVEIEGQKCAGQMRLVALANDQDEMKGNKNDL